MVLRRRARLGLGAVDAHGACIVSQGLARGAGATLSTLALLARVDGNRVRVFLRLELETPVVHTADLSGARGDGWNRLRRDRSSLVRNPGGIGRHDRVRRGRGGAVATRTRSKPATPR